MRDDPNPRICATLAVPSLDRLRTMASSAISQGADLIELRLDHLRRLPEAEELRWCRGLGVPVIVTIRRPCDGGRYSGSEETRAFLLRGLAGTCDYIDLELRSARDQLVREITDKGSKVLVSHHDLDGTPPDQELLSVLGRARAVGAHVSKIATFVNSPKDVLRLLALPLLVSPTVVVPMGDKGRIGRILAPYFGSEFAYAYPAGTVRIAPGMISVSELRAIYGHLNNLVDRGAVRW